MEISSEDVVNARMLLVEYKRQCKKFGIRFSYFGFLGWLN